MGMGIFNVKGEEALTNTTCKYSKEREKNALGVALKSQL
jgi:hypothetical protein